MTEETFDQLAAARDYIQDLEGALDDTRRLAREIDVALHGEEGAAEQPSLCDLVAPARKARDLIDAQDALQAELTKLREVNAYLAGLVSTADCPQCDGSGVVTNTVVGCLNGPTGSGECCGNPEPQPCQWCYEKSQALAASEELNKGLPPTRTQSQSVLSDPSEYSDS